MSSRSGRGVAVAVSLATVVALCGRSEAVDGLIGWWKLDDGSGSTATDSVGTNDGTLLGGMTGTEWTTGQFDGALIFGGGTNYVNCGADASLTTPQMTIAFWMKAYNSQNSCVVDKLALDDGSVGWSMKTRIAEGPNAIWFRVGDEVGPNTLDAYGPADSYVNGTWVHVAGTYDAEDIVLFLDGVEVARSNFPGRTINATTIELWLGRASKNGGEEPYTGELDDVQLYDRALTEQEIVDVMNGASEGTTVAITAPDATAAEEGPETGTFTVTRTGAISSALTVNLSIAGTATETTDYTTAPDIIAGDTVVIPADSASVDITVTPVTDSNYVEGNETVVVTVLDGGAEYAAGAQDTATITIADYVVDAPGVFYLVSPADGATNAGLTPTLTWSASLRATSYTVTVYSDESKITQVDTATVAETTYTVPAGANLDNELQYWWEVTASNAAPQDTDAQNNMFSFYTTPSGSPTVLSSSPARDATDVSISDEIRVTFSEPMDPTSVTDATTLRGPTGSILGATKVMSVNDTMLTVTPDEDFAYDSDYTVTILDTATDVSGKVLDGDGTGGAGGNFVLAFTTEEELTGYGEGEGCLPAAGGVGVAWTVLVCGALLRRRKVRKGMAAAAR